MDVGTSNDRSAVPISPEVFRSPFPSFPSCPVVQRHGRIHPPQELEDPQGQALRRAGRRHPRARVQGVSLEPGRQREPAHRYLRGRPRQVRADAPGRVAQDQERSEETTSELQSLMRLSYAVFCLTKKTPTSHTPDSREITTGCTTETTAQ